MFVIILVAAKRFLRSGKLKLHKNVHSKEKPYPCQDCGKVSESLPNKLAGIDTFLGLCPPGERAATARA